MFFSFARFFSISFSQAAILVLKIWDSFFLMFMLACDEYLRHSGPHWARNPKGYFMWEPKLTKFQIFAAVLLGSNRPAISFFNMLKLNINWIFKFSLIFFFFRWLRSHILSVCKYACEQKEGCLWILQEGEGVGGGWSKNWLALVWMQRRGFIKKAYQGWR